MLIRTLENGLAVNKQATIQGVEKSDADSVLVSIVNGFKHVGINNWREGLVACGSDGASVMTGVRNGVTAKLRQEVPWQKTVTAQSMFQVQGGYHTTVVL